MEQPPPFPETSTANAPIPRTTSLLARLLNVFASPGEVFAEVKASRASVGNWLAPALIACVAGILSVFVMFSQPALLQPARVGQEQAMEARVKAGQMTRAQADWIIAIVENPAVMKSAGSLLAVAASFARLFWWGLGLWLLGRWFLKARFDYMKAVEVTGLASMIAVLGTIVSLLLIVNLGKMISSSSLALAMSDFNPDHQNVLLAGAMNVFTFWYLGVLAAGLSRLANASFPRAMFLVLGAWVLMLSFLILSGLGSLGV